MMIEMKMTSHQMKVYSRKSVYTTWLVLVCFWTEKAQGIHLFSLRIEFHCPTFLGNKFFVQHFLKFFSQLFGIIEVHFTLLV
jgi:hypothetical protein